MYTVKFAVYKTNTRVEFKIKKEFKGSYLRIVDDLLDYSELFNDISAKIVDYQPQRVELQSFPGPSLRESILNALCHTDFFIRSNIKIEFFIDRVEITSPGNIYGGYTLEEILNGRQTLRNPVLVNLLDKLDFVENYATGLERTIEAYNNYEWKPKFEVTNNSFRVILPNLNYYKNNLDNKLSKNLDFKNLNPAQLSNLQTKILELIKKNINISIQEIAEAVGKDRSTVLRNIKRLKEINLLKRDSSKKTGSWMLF